MPPTAEIVSFDALRLPDSLLTVPASYLDPLNFATNFAFFRDADGLHTRLVTANYWSRYGAGEVTLALILFDDAGRTLAEWREKVAAPNAAITLDSREIRERFGLPAFAGQPAQQRGGRQRRHRVGHRLVEAVAAPDVVEGLDLELLHRPVGRRIG